MGVFESEIITRHAASKDKRWLAILTLEQLWMRIIVVVGQKPLVIFHVTLDDDDNSEAKRRNFCAQFTHSFSHSYTPASRYTPTASLRNEDVLHRVPSATRYYDSVPVPSHTLRTRLRIPRRRRDARATESTWRGQARQRGDMENQERRVHGVRAWVTSRSVIVLTSSPTRCGMTDARRKGTRRRNINVCRRRSVP